MPRGGPHMDDYMGDSADPVRLLYRNADPRAGATAVEGYRCRAATDRYPSAKEQKGLDDSAQRKGPRSHRTSGALPRGRLRVCDGQGR